MWKRCAGRHRAQIVPYPERSLPTPPLPPSPVVADHADSLRPLRGAGYHSRVCSIMGAAIDRIADAIDQLANDAQGPAPEAELTARVADIWLMVEELDPELARRQRRYTSQADGTPQ